MTYNTLAKICAAISISPIVFGFMGFEFTESHWALLFFGGLAFAILFNALDEQEKEIAMLRSPKEGKQAKEEGREIDPRSGDPFYISDNFNPNRKLLEKDVKEEIELVFFPKYPIKPTKDNQQTKL